MLSDTSIGQGVLDYKTIITEWTLAVDGHGLSQQYILKICDFVINRM
jgi:hypothetical protein